MKPLSQKLAELSAQAKTTEDHVAKAQTEAHDRLQQRREQVRQETEKALGKVKQRLETAKGETRMRFDALHAKVNADFEQMKKDAGEKKRKFEAWQAQNYAGDKEADALAAIDYAVAATKIAELQTLDAIAARVEADSKSEQIKVSPTMA
jgi:DNA anti-recombination protein RmuC